MATNVLLLSATIKPLAGLPAMARTDPAVRLNDYLHAFGHYLSLLGPCFDGIVFAENSGSDLTPLADLAAARGAGDRVEFVSFQGLDFPPEHGRGYGEFKLVDHAMAHSRLLAGGGDGQFVWKCTGRYLLKNMAALVRRRPPEADLYCHMRNYPFRRCELYMLSWNRRGYDGVIRGVYHHLKNDQPGGFRHEEALFRDWVDAHRDRVRVVPRFRQVPLIEGFRGWNNSAYGDGLWSKKALARQFSKVFLPWLWI